MMSLCCLAKTIFANTSAGSEMLEFVKQQPWKSATASWILYSHYFANTGAGSVMLEFVVQQIGGKKR